MPHIDLESYFARVDYRGARQASLESLRELQAAHALAIPFENIDVIRGLGVRLDEFGLRFPTGTRFGSPGSAWPAGLADRFARLSGRRTSP